MTKKKATKAATAKKKTTAKKKAVKKAQSKKTSAKAAPKAKPVKKTQKQKVEEVKEAIKDSAVTPSKSSTYLGELSRAQIRSIERMIQTGGEWEKIASYLEGVAKPYSMGLNFSEKTAISHPKLGVGYIMSAENNRIKVFFESGIKNLVMNYRK